MGGVALSRLLPRAAGGGKDGERKLPSQSPRDCATPPPPPPPAGGGRGPGFSKTHLLRRPPASLYVNSLPPLRCQPASTPSTYLECHCRRLLHCQCPRHHHRRHPSSVPSLQSVSISLLCGWIFILLKIIFPSSSPNCAVEACDTEFMCC